MPCLVRLAVTILLTAVSAQTDTELVYNPGPSYRCYDFGQRSPCQPDLTTTSYDSECSGVTPNPPSFTASWYNSNLDTDGVFPGGNGTPMNITLINRAISTEAECSVSCGNLTEVSFEYTYPGFSIRKDSHGNEYNLAEYDQWIVEYDVTIHQVNDCPECAQWYSLCYESKNETYPGVCQVPGQGQGDGCKGYMRQYLTTDFIYNWYDQAGKQYKNLISIIHYNPIETAAYVGPFDDEENGGYRIAVNGPPGLIPGQTTRVALDFKRLIEQYSAQLCHSGNGQIPASMYLYSLQIVSSNVNTSSAIDITNTNIILRNNPNPSIIYPTPTATYPTPTYCPMQTQTSTSRTCSVAYTFESTWSTGYTVDVKVTNHGSSTIQGWDLTWKMPGSDTIASDWNSVIRQTGNSVVAQNNTANNGIIGPGQTVDFGFNANTGSTPVAPNQFILNGQTCADS